ncbi:flavohemoglobin expression-modulating QEGLA motif protein [Roseivirga sp. BDSF3-8]|uniref:flavohemoglobin expression-modulating QEGLA motif protein n=1 Tax=Roseivirga sp. BDSF3-8 TaxID=3241598 RepID=UPI0035321440
MIELDEHSTELEDIIHSITTEDSTVKSLKGNGFLYLEHEVPFLIVYNRSTDDPSMLRLVRSKASYMFITDEEPEYFQALVHQITRCMTDKFGSFLVMEIFIGPEGSREFILTGHEKKLPATLSVLQEELGEIDSRRLNLELDAQLREPHERKKEDHYSILNIKELERTGAQYLQLEVPPVYKSEQGEVFPLYFRKFRESFARALQKAMFEYTRVQTTSPIDSYIALGKRQIDEDVFKVDKQLYKIQAGYQFLWLVAPNNIMDIRNRFFESNLEEVVDYHYRLLPIDPDLLKRDLFNVKIEDIDDPALAFIFDEKREELDQELTMLKERGSRNFLYRSVRLYKGLDDALIKEAEMILKEIDEVEETEEEKPIGAKEFARMAEKEFDYFKEQSPGFSCRVHVRDDVNIIMVSKGELYLPADYRMTETEATGLIQHEIGTHALTFYNGKQQPLHQMAIGLADYDALQEGVAVLSEYLGGALSGNRLRILAGRVVAGNALLRGLDFKQMFHMLHGQYGFSKDHAFNITSRMFQGGGFLKDIIYLKGLMEVREYLAAGGDLSFLLSGKFALKHVGLIRELTTRGILNPPAVLPRYMESPDYQDKIRKIREGIPLYKLKQV